MGNNIPDSWKWVSLGDICTDPQYGWTSKSSKMGTVKYLRTTDISSREVNWEKVPFCNILPDDISKYIIKKYDLLVSRAGSIGLSYLVKDLPYTTIFASYLIRFKPVIVDSQYVYFYLQSNDYWNFITQSAAGIAVQNVNAQKLKNLPIPLSPLPEQNRISKKLDSLFKDIYSIKVRLEKFPQIIKDFRQSILDLAVAGVLTKDWRKKYRIKKNWKKVLLKEHSLKIGSGSTPRGGQSSYLKKGTPLIRSMNVHFQGFKYKGLAYISKSQAYELRSVAVKKGDVLLNITGASIGRVCQAPVNMDGARVNQHVCIIRTKSSISQSFLNYYLASPQMQKFIDTENYGATRQALTKTMIENFIIPLPDKNEQKEIVYKIKKYFTITDNIEKKYQKIVTIFNELPNQILEQSFKGKLVKQNPKDEPVEKLLERVKEEKLRITEQLKLAKKKKRIKKPKLEVKLMEIVELLKKNGRMKVEDVWKQSDYSDDIDKFYAELKKLIDIEKKVKDIKKDLNVYLELTNENR